MLDLVDKLKAAEMLDALQLLARPELSRYKIRTRFAAYFFVPLLAMFDFSTQVRGSAPGRTWDNWTYMFQDEDLRSSIIASLLLALFTVVLMVALLVPTMVWVRLRVPGARKLIEFLCLLPLTIPALVIVVGISNVYSWVTYVLGDSPLVLTFAYVVGGSPSSSASCCPTSLAVCSAQHSSPSPW